MSKRTRKSRTTASPKASKEEQTGDLLSGGGGDDLLEFDSHKRNQATIKVVGVGGGGGNALNNMIASGLGGVEFVVANTDAQALEHNAAPIKIQLGVESTRGLGCGADPDRGRGAALEVRERLRETFADTDMVFVTAGLGGGTGTGAAPIVAEIAREAGALTVGVVTKPFVFEGKVRARNAERGLDELHSVVDTVITIPNQRLLALAGKNTAMQDAFALADEVLFNAVRGISDLITIHGLINLDFADVRTIMNEMGVALMGTGTASGDERAVEAARAAISSPLLEDLSIEGAHGVLINITGGPDLTLFEVNEASTLIQEAAHEDVNIIFGAVIDDSMAKGEMRVTVIATGLDDQRVRRGRDTLRTDEVHDNVMRLHRDREQEPSSLSGTAPAARNPSEPFPAESSDSLGAPLLAPDGGEGNDEFLSPFEEDEQYDVPTFLRRGGHAETDEEAEEPAFLRAI